VMVMELEDVGVASAAWLSSEELDCKICYRWFNLGGRRPKVLACCHRLCSRCLLKLQDLGEAPPGAVVCPFCRRTTRLPGEVVSSLPDDGQLVAVLAVQSRNQRNLPENAELVLSPRRLSSLVIRSSSNFVLITIMEPPGLLHRPWSQQDRSSSLDSVVSARPRWSAWAWARALLWVLGLVYFGSLPLGMYLLLLQQSRLGVMLVSLVPAGLLVVAAYGLCRCAGHQLRRCWPP
uniref:E3 ubiquitin-protein ligase RNF182 n=1 Tax=Tetraodon nigroviridis TaxID=99883 RepID=H3BY00_TETNG